MNLRGIEAEIARRAAKADLERTAKNADQIREKCKSLYEFVREFWIILEPGAEFKGGWALQTMCKFLEAVSAGRIQYLLITVPPGMMKSLLVSVFWPLWEWSALDRPDYRILSTSFSQKNVLRDNGKMKRLIESDKFQQLYGDKFSQSNKWGEEKFENSKTGFREGRAFDSMTGGRGDRVLIDDPHSVKKAESDKERANTVKTFREAIPDRLNDMTKSVIIVIMQRLHANDVAGTILDLDLPYVHLNLPMEFEPRKFNKETGKYSGGPCEVYLENPDTGEPELFFRDPRTKEGELLFSERFPRKEIEALKKVKGAYAWAGQYQQRPTAREGGLFKRKWFVGKIVEPEEVPATRRRVRAWDRAATIPEAGKEPDYTAGVRMSRHGPDYYIEHVIRDRDTAGNIRKLIKGMAETDPPGTIIRLPKEPGQAGNDQAEQDVIAFAGYPVHVKPFSKDEGGKLLRASGFAIQAEYGHVYLVRGPWVEPFLEELCAFPTGPNDDQVDGAADAFDELTNAAVGKFEFESAGPREVVATAERDNRYNFGDIDDDSFRGSSGGIDERTL